MCDSITWGGAPRFDEFVDVNPALLDRKLLNRFYRPETLTSDRARQDWVEPDLRPFPWQLLTGETGHSSGDADRSAGQRP